MNKFNLGDKVPNFELPSTSGYQYDFESFRNDNKGWQLVIYFRGSWCPVCVEDLKELEKNKGYFEDKGVYFTVVSADNLDNLNQMVEKHNFTFPVLSDQDLNVLKAYDVFYHNDNDLYEDHGAHGEPAYFLTDEGGTLLYQQKQTSPFGRPTATELRKIVQWIKKKLKA
ncbi:peroxiredoxin family protein [Cytobacillus oceanisediminis]|uniref:peroxiredoxin family protein n=1 Tax=Cytobacillus oceanisediminis TaxID=665099 RepID=UPI0037358C1A